MNQSIQPAATELIGPEPSGLYPTSTGLGGGGLPSGAVQTSYGYDAYGVTNASGTANDNSYQFTGRSNDGMGLYYNRARYYNPVWGRFISEDPTGLLMGANVYAYVDGKPANFIDPTGLWTFQIGLSLNYQLGPLNGNWSGGLVFDGHGDVGTYKTSGGGIGAGAGLGGGVQFLESTGDCIQDIADVFGNTSVAAGTIGLQGYLIRASIHSNRFASMR